MRKQTIIYVFVVLVLAGLADALYLAVSRYVGSDLVCGLIEGCNAVAQSEHSVLFGVPLAYLGVGYYLAAFVAGIGLLSGGQIFNRYSKWIFLLTIFGGLFSIYFVYVQLALINAICVYCLISAVITWTMVYIGWKIWILGEIEPSEVIHPAQG